MNVAGQRVAERAAGATRRNGAGPGEAGQPVRDACRHHPRVKPEDQRRGAVRYGHKLNLTTGRSGLILDLVIEASNPADSDRLMPMLERRVRRWRTRLRQSRRTRAP